jgi:crossover junction endodeoxyribonuclease RuvC
MSDITDVVGIDPSLNGTAVCVLNNKLEHTCFRFTSEYVGTSMRERMARYRSVIVAIDQHVRWDRVHAVYLESYSFASRGQSVIDLAELGGVLRQHLINTTEGLGIAEPVELTPSTIKKFATGKGTADKIQMAVAIAKRWGVEFQTSDEYDAYAIARIGACIAGWCDAETDYQREAIDVVLHGKAKPKKRKSA